MGNALLATRKGIPHRIPLKFQRRIPKETIPFKFLHAQTFPPWRRRTPARFADNRSRMRATIKYRKARVNAFARSHYLRSLTFPKDFVLLLQVLHLRLQVVGSPSVLVRSSLPRIWSIFPTLRQASAPKWYSSAIRLRFQTEPLGHRH